MRLVGSVGEVNLMVSGLCWTEGGRWVVVRASARVIRDAKSASVGKKS